MKACLTLAGVAVLVALGLHDAQLLRHDGKATTGHITPAAKASRHSPLPPGATMTETAHYRIHSTAEPEQTAQVARAVESLHEQYTAMFPSPGGRATKLTLVLYRDRAEFKRNNRSRPWAEAYYLPPRSYAYFDGSARNPYHWMLHEATHQLMREVSGFKRAKWLDEGLASYFGASRMRLGTLVPGDADPDAYPIWWLSSYPLSGDLERDISTGQIIPLAHLISGRGGLDENRYFNQYYIHYWSLTDFLIRHRDGIYAAGYKQLVAKGGTIEDFTLLIGPPERVQQEWYQSLLRTVEQAKARP